MNTSATLKIVVYTSPNYHEVDGSTLVQDAVHQVAYASSKDQDRSGSCTQSKVDGILARG